MIVDRFSGWPEVLECGDSTGSAMTLIKVLRGYFARFGVPEEISSDGGLTFVSGETQSFFEQYGSNIEYLQ